jgi:Domain of unknown function (DUF6398)
VAKKGRHRKGGRVTPKGTRPLGFQPLSYDEPEDFWSEPEPDLMRDVRRALADDHPLSFLELVSTMLHLVDPRPTSPFGRDLEKTETSAEELVRTFIEVDSPETTALLAAMAALTDNVVQQRRIERAIRRRTRSLPEWLARIDRAVAYRASEMTHVLGDGDDVLVGVRLATGEELTAVVYIDHNLGRLVKDAFVVTEPIEQLEALMRAKNDDPDNTTVADIPLADARARIDDAIRVAAITYPPFDSDTWPSSRPLIEWMVRLLPDGGRGYLQPMWTGDDRQRLIDRFFASSFAADLDDPDDRDLIENLLWFGCDYGPGDPIRWSPVAVEIFLVDWMPRKVIATTSYLARMPMVLRKFIRYCHAERGVPAALTAETLEAVDRWEPGYQAAIHSPDVDRWTSLDEDDKEPDLRQLSLTLQQEAVGGAQALDELDDEPLPDEQFDWTDIDDDVHERVAEILGLCDECCDEFFDAEYRTAARRVLARIARTWPEPLRRGRAETAAAAICTAVDRANWIPKAPNVVRKYVLAHFGLRSSVTERMRTLLDAGDFPRYTLQFSLGSPDYLASGRRRYIMETRDHHMS